MNRSGPFDASTCPQASLADLDAERMAWFIDRARQVRGFPLPPNASASELLTHLNLLPRTAHARRRAALRSPAPALPAQQ